MGTRKGNRIHNNQYINNQYQSQCHINSREILRKNHQKRKSKAN